jgi:hypothetical protein
LLAQARIGYPDRRYASAIDLGIVVAGEELDVRTESLGEPCGTAQDRLLLVGIRIDND